MIPTILRVRHNKLVKEAKALAKKAHRILDLMDKHESLSPAEIDAAIRLDDLLFAATRMKELEK